MENHKQLHQNVQCNLYLCASFRMLGVPSNKVERLSGATMKTLAILQKSVQKSVKNVRQGKKFKVVVYVVQLTCPTIQISHRQKEH